VSEFDSANISKKGACLRAQSLAGYSGRGRLLIHYRKRAEEVRIVAENYVEPTRKILIDIAGMYEKLAEDIAADIE